MNAFFKEKKLILIVLCVNKIPMFACAMCINYKLCIVIEMIYK